MRCTSWIRSRGTVSLAKTAHLSLLEIERSRAGSTRPSPRPIREPDRPTSTTSSCFFRSRSGSPTVSAEGESACYSDGTEGIERFSDEAALSVRQAALDRALQDEGWTGPHGGPL